MTQPIKNADPYGFDPDFERAMVTLASSRPRFFGRIAHELDPALLGDDRAKLALEAARAIYKELGHGPDNLLLVVQRLRRMVSDGKVTYESALAVSDYLDDGEDSGLPAEEGIVNELRPMLQRRMRATAVRAAHGAFANPRDDFSSVTAMLDRANRVGQSDVSVGVKLGDASFDEISKLRMLSRLPTGILELDAPLDGGLQLGGLGVVIAGAGAGKSMFLSHVGGVSVRGCFFVAVATLELPEPVWLARVTANILGIPINSLLDGDDQEAKRRLSGMALGPCVVKEFTPHATTVEDIRDWIGLVEDDAGRKVDLLIVDYADKLSAKHVSGKKDDGEYTMGRVVYEGLRIFAHERKMWCWTGSQASRVKDQRKRLDLSDVADSMHKVRVADLVITLTPKDEGESLLYFIAKHRTGKSRLQVGPLPTDFEMGRCAPILEDA